MPRSQWLNVLVILLVIIAAIYLGQIVLRFLGDFSDVILLFGIAWLVSLTLEPLISYVQGKPLPAPLVRAAYAAGGARIGDRAARYRTSRSTGVELVYLSFGLFVLALIALFIPATVVQLSQLINQLPDLVKRLPELTVWVQTRLDDLNVPISVQNTVATLLGALQTVTSSLLQNMLGVVSSLVSVIGNTIFVLIISIFFAMDRPRMGRTFQRVIPDQFRNYTDELMLAVGRTFGGFFRAQLIQAFIMGVGAFFTMGLLRMDFVMAASVFSGLFMVIPLVGSFLALIPPVLVALLTQPGNTLLLIIVLLVIQFVLTNLISPKLLADAVGLHPLLVFAALLIGIKVAGFWGAIFGVPVAGVISSMTFHMYRLWTERRTNALAEGDSPPLPDTRSMRTGELPPAPSESNSLRSSRLTGGLPPSPPERPSAP